MADEGDFTKHDLKHFRIEAFRTSAQYVYPTQGRDPNPPLKKDPVAHSQVLVEQLGEALGAIPAQNDDDRFTFVGHRLGANVEVQTTPPDSDRKGPARAPDLDFAAQGISVLRSTRDDERSETALVFIPDSARNFLIDRIRSYGVENMGNRKRPEVQKFEPIEVFRSAPGRRLFVGDVDFDANEPSWWEVWVSNPAHVDAIVARAQEAEFEVHHERLEFPDTTVLFLHGQPQALAAFLGRIPGLVSEVRKAIGNIEPFLQVTGEVTQHDWVDELAGRIALPAGELPAICVLDSGVSAAHPLIQPGLAGAWTVDAAWGADDHHPDGGHGTPMAGAVLHGDLFWRMNDDAPVEVTHHVESVKFLPPEGFPPNQPPSYGTITQSAVAVAELERPNIVRSFCVATSARDFAPGAPSSWSGAIDQISAGSMPGERNADVAAKDHPKRLVLVATGNRTGGIKYEVLQHHSLEDPAQSWNALTIGGYTAKDIGPVDEPELLPLVGANEKSPYSCGSQYLPTDLTPIKPEVLFEAGNMLVDGMEYCDWHEAVSLLSTGSDVAGSPLVPFWATSAATGIAGNFLGRLKSALPGMWPETYRALLVHSADWPQPIRSKFIGTGAHWKTGGKAAKQLMLRDVGYGVPNLARAIASARSDVTLLTQAEIRPYTMGQGSAVYNEVHFYDLPWPRQKLEEMENQIVTMKVTLSYFPEPNLSGRAATRPDTYRSFGLRFDLKKRTETEDDFHSRLSKPEGAPEQEAEGAPEGDGEGGGAKETSYWLLGPKAVNAGSLHCDLWRGHAIDLSSHDHIAVFPVGGWWKSHLGQQRANDIGRYALAISITAEGQDVDLYSEIVTEVEAAMAAVGVDIEIDE